VKVSNAIAEILKREGTEFVIGYPVNHVLESAAEIDVRPIIVRQERIGLHMADAISRVTNGDKIGVFCMQHGPGTENAFGGVAQAYGDSSPIVVIPMGYPRRIANMPPNFSSLLNFGNVTKWLEQVNLTEQVPEAMRRAYTQVRNGRPRPALIEIPSDIMTAEFEGTLDYTPAPRLRSGPDPRDVVAVARALVKAERPVIYAGQGVHYSKAYAELKELVELLEAPITTSLQGKSAFPDDHPLSLGQGSRAIPKPVHHFFQNADLIFGIGCSFASSNYNPPLPAGKRFIHATLDPADINKDVRSELQLVGDAQLTLAALIDAVRDELGGKKRNRQAAITAEIQDHRNQWFEKWMPKLKSNETPMSPYRVIWDMINTIDVANTIITHDAGSPRDQLAPFYPATTPMSYIGWGKTTQLGTGLGFAMGAKLARPDKLCINVWGDAAIGFTGMDFETAVRERIPILSILMNNFCMAIELPIMKTSTAKYRSTDISGNYADMAKAFGGYGERITTPDQIIPAIKRGIEKTREGTPALLEFITAQEHDYSVFR
jgi:thiamine pyrophosphate-dependent acetolactate synthase large subunit-like protein